MVTLDIGSAQYGPSLDVAVRWICEVGGAYPGGPAGTNRGGGVNS